jgi:DNA-binding MarR family transcriptional regulator
VSGRPIRRGPLLLVYALGHQTSQLLGATFTNTPLSPDDFAVYSALRLVGPCTPTHLANTLGMRAPTLSNYRRRMEQRGHLRRRRNPNDGRSSLIRLTPAGTRITEACFPAFGAAIEAVRTRLGDNEGQILAAMEELSRCLGAALAELTVEVPATAQP